MDEELRVGGHLVLAGNKACLYCGATRDSVSSNPDVSCVQAMTNQPRQFKSAMNDTDAINEGILRLRRERVEMLKRNAE